MQDTNSRVACECCATTGVAVVIGEITTKANIDVQTIARDAIREVGYDEAEYGFDADTCAVIVSLKEQSPDIAMGVNNALEGRAEGKGETGAGDQGMMFGYACDETEELMPLPASYAHKLARKLAEARKDGTLPYLRPDGKTQITIEYSETGKPIRAEAVVVSSQHSPDIDMEALRADIKRCVIDAIIPPFLIDKNTKIFINPTGRFVVGGPKGDSGLTGRKIIVDTYGGCARHGGGSFSGKDPTKVDRSAAYAARHAAKNIVAAGLATRCEIQLAYAIGVAHPVSIMVDTFGTGICDDSLIAEAAGKVFDFTPDGIIEKFDLRRPIYKQLSSYGHMGRTDLGVPWERVDMVEELKAAIKYS